MLNIYRVQDAELVPIEGEAPGNCWINLAGPTHNELQRLEKEFNIPIELLTAALDPDERPRVEFDEGCMLILTRVPFINDNDDDQIPYLTRPLGVVLARNGVMLTICTRETPIITDFLNAKVKGFNPENRVRFVLQIINRITLRYLRYLKDLDLRADEVENELKHSTDNADILRLMNIEKCLVYFNTSLRSNYLMLQRLQKTRMMRNAGEEESEIMEDILIDNAQAIEMTKIYTNIVKTQMDAFTSIINNNLNSVINRLTKITLLLAAPTLVASIYGMNVVLPFQQHPAAFWIVLGIAIVVVGGIYTFFLKPKR